jgi:hypothetical protein
MSVDIRPFRSVRTPAAKLEGVVSDIAGHPIAGAEVTLLPQDVTVITGADGTFSVILPAGRVLLQVNATGYAPAAEEAIDMVPGARWVRQISLASLRQPRSGATPPRTAWSGPRASIR